MFEGYVGCELMIHIRSAKLSFLNELPMCGISFYILTRIGARWHEFVTIHYIVERDFFSFVGTRICLVLHYRIVTVVVDDVLRV